MHLLTAKNRHRNFQTLVYEATKRIPRGRVATYAAIARVIGRPGAVRAVGNALNKNHYKSVPCHRVIRSDGSVGGYVRGTNKKITRLLREGVMVKKGAVDLSQFGHTL